MTHREGLPLVDLRPGSRDGWSYSTWLRIGVAHSALNRDGWARRFGVYAVRRTRENVLQVYLQHEGCEHLDGTVIGVSLLSSSADLEPYFWTPAASMTNVAILRTQE